MGKITRSSCFIKNIYDGQVRIHRVDIMMKGILTFYSSLEDSLGSLVQWQGLFAYPSAKSTTYHNYEW
ncbi:MAG: hypothetical protein HY276_03885 [Ignavibacteriales bacterium]|nr:hypothetical protein [Ignavibacteriales bacterium]